MRRGRSLAGRLEGKVDPKSRGPGPGRHPRRRRGREPRPLAARSPAVIRIGPVVPKRRGDREFEALSEPFQRSFKREIWPVVKLRVRAGESIQEAVRRFRKLCERSGLRKEMRRKAYYAKPSERRRREELKRLRKARQHQTSRD